MRRKNKAREKSMSPWRNKISLKWEEKKQ